MKHQEISIVSINELPALAKGILQFAGGRKVFAFEADMGAGKTTLIKEICRQLGSQDSFSSPTFSIVNEYAIPGTMERIYHIDLYRVKDLNEAQALGMEEYLNDSDYCFIEWPGLIEPLLPAETVNIHIKSEGNIRNVSIFMN